MYFKSFQLIFTDAFTQIDSQMWHSCGAGRKYHKLLIHTSVSQLESPNYEHNSPIAPIFIEQDLLG